MCGIAGVISRTCDVEALQVRSMTDVIAHRGPDGEGCWVSDDRQVGLGHRRLSIIDLSHSGDQPMCYMDRYWIIFNGEIYNYIELRADLQSKGYIFRSQSDTEVLMALYHAYGADCLNQLDGMFAFALYDTVDKTLFMARDRFGEKPLYYAILPDRILFGSEMKSLWAAGLSREPDMVMVYNYLEFGYEEDPDHPSATFYRNISSLEPGTYCFINRELDMSVRRYWDLRPDEVDHSISMEAAIDRTQALLLESVRRRLRSDVPVGSSLSGGLDSSAVVCAVDHLRSGESPVQAVFSARFPGFDRDESRYQQIVVDATRVKPFSVEPTEQSMLALLEKIMWHQEQPFGSASITAQYEVFARAKQEGVTVLLDGQGADEVFAGYHMYFRSYLNELRSGDQNLYREQRIRYQELHADNLVNPVFLDESSGSLRKFAPEFLLRVAKKLRSSGGPLSPFYGPTIRDVSKMPKFRVSYAFNTLNQALYYSTRNYGLGQLLRYADRNSMANSREVRLPFLYHKLVEFAFSLPPQFKIRDGWTKYPLRKAVEGFTPKEIVWRKDKIGYEPPQRSWLQAKKVRDMMATSVDLGKSMGVLDRKADPSKVFGNEEAGWRLLMLLTLK